MNTQRISWRDQPWQQQMVSSLVGPVRIPNAADVVEAIVELVTHFPDSRLGWRVDDRARRWLVDQAGIRDRAAGMVVISDDDPGANYSAFLTSFGNSALPRPVSFLLARDHFGMRSSHAIGDGRTITAFVSGVLATAISGQLPQWPTDRAVRYPYLFALAEFFGRSPGRVPIALRAARPQRASSTHADLAWTPQPQTVYARVDAAAFEAIKAWRRVHASGAPMPSIELALLLRGLHAAGLQIHHEVLTLFDARRYLRRGRVDGNFVAGVFVPLTAQSSVRDICDMFESTASSGRPLTALGTGLLPRRRPVAIDCVPENATTKLAFTHMGRPQQIERLPFQTGSSPVYVGSIDPADPQGLTVATTQTGGRLHMSATFHRNVTNADAVVEALDLIAADPVALLMEPAPFGRGSVHMQHGISA